MDVICARYGQDVHFILALSPRDLKKTALILEILRPEAGLWMTENKTPIIQQELLFRGNIRLQGKKVK